MAGVATGTLALAADAPKSNLPAKKETVIIGGKTAAGAKAKGDDAAPEPANLMLNFRGVPLDLVLQYLTEAAGYIVNIEAPVRGTVDVFSAKPLTKTEALDVLNAALDKNGLAALVSGRMLTIKTKENAMRGLTEVKNSPRPAEIPNDGKIVTQIMAVTHVPASTLIRDLAPILPTGGTMVANEAGNAIIVTDTQANIKHLAEIVEAIDTSISSIAGIRVFMLQYADSKSVVSVIKELFASDSSGGGASNGRNGSSPFGGITSRFGGAGGIPGGFGGGGTPGGGRTSGGGSRASSAAKVVAVADDRSNSVVVTAPDDVMPTVEELIKAVDINVEDVTELKVFRLKYCDPTEMATLLAGLFPDDTKTSSQNNGSRTGSPFGAGPTSRTASPAGAGSSAAGASDRAMKQSRVIAVPDQRTTSLVITTSHDLMRQIETMIEKLDSDSSRKQQVFVYSLENAEAQQVQQVLQDLFQNSSTSGSSSSSRSRSGSQQTGVLSNRATQTTTGSSGSSSRGSAPRIGGGGN